MKDICYFTSLSQSSGNYNRFVNEKKFSTTQSLNKEDDITKYQCFGICQMMYE